MLVAAITLTRVVCAQDPTTVGSAGAAPTNVRFEDIPNDAGNGVRVSWVLPSVVGLPILSYEILMVKSAADTFALAAVAGPHDSTVVVRSSEDFGIKAGVSYYGKVVALDSVTAVVRDSLHPDSSSDVRTIRRLRRSESPVIGPFQTRASWFNTGRINVLLLIVIFYGLVLYMVRRARLGHELKFRRIAGIDAVDEAIGRATELGKPVLYVPGTQDIDNIQTIASLQMLTSVAGKAATYDIPIIVPLNRAFMVSVAEEAVRQGYLNAGRLDAYNRDNIRYLSDEQFAFTSGVTGIMMREKTAAHLFLGAFFGESLILSETGYATGAIQIAGTANIHQLPFFVVACDYTLIGEEYFATSALVTRNPDLLGTIKATDWIKLILISALALTAVLEMFGVHTISSWFVIP